MCCRVRPLFVGCFVCVNIPRTSPMFSETTNIPRQMSATYPIVQNLLPPMCTAPHPHWLQHCVCSQQTHKPPPDTIQKPHTLSHFIKTSKRTSKKTSTAFVIRETCYKMLQSTSSETTITPLKVLVPNHSVKRSKRWSYFYSRQLLIQ